MDRRGFSWFLWMKHNLSKQKSETQKLDDRDVDLSVGGLLVFVFVLSDAWSVFEKQGFGWVHMISATMQTLELSDISLALC